VTILSYAAYVSFSYDKYLPFLRSFMYYLWVISIFIIICHWSQSLVDIHVIIRFTRAACFSSSSTM